MIRRREFIFAAAAAIMAPSGCSQRPDWIFGVPIRPVNKDDRWIEIAVTHYGSASKRMPGIMVARVHNDVGWSNLVEVTALLDEKSGCYVIWCGTAA